MAEKSLPHRTTGGLGSDDEAVPDIDATNVNCQFSDIIFIVSLTEIGIDIGFAARASASVETRVRVLGELYHCYGEGGKSTC